MNAVTGLLVLTLLGAEGTPSKQDVPPREEWKLPLSEAVRIGLANAEVVRTVCERVEEDGQVYVTIAPADRVAAAWQFKAEVMALVRSIELCYWTVAQQRAQLAASEQAVATAREVVKRERAELSAGRGTVADVAEAEQRLEQFSLDVVTKTSDVITAERQFRRVAGLPPTDNRQVVPSTPLVETEMKPDWNACVATMMNAQPDIARQRMVVCASGLQYLVARGPALLLNLGHCAEDAATHCNADQAQSAFRTQQAALQQVIHQTTHSLARFFLEIDANYKQFKTASRLRAAAAQRLEAQRAFHEEGRIPIDRYLDAVSQYASAVAQEAQFKTAYNVSLMSLEEAKGTLLAYRQVTVEEAAPPVETEVVSSPAPRTADPDVKQTDAEVEVEVEAASTPTPVRNVTFDITIGEATPIRVRGTLSISTDREPATARK